MRKTTERKTENPIAVDINMLAGMLSCGEATARQIGEDAAARIYVGRRVLYSVKKIQNYIEKIAF